MDKKKLLLYIAKRIVLSILTIFAITSLVFLISQIIPGGPFSGAKNLNYEVRKIQEKIYGLDKPVIVQYILYIFNISKFNFGNSISRKGVSVIEIISNSYGYSLGIGLAASFISIILGIAIGYLATIKRGKLFDKIITFLTLTIISVPLFVIACFFNKTLSAFFPYEGIMRFFLPVITLSITPLCAIIRITKSSMINTLEGNNSYFIKTLRARGIPERDIILKHALPNSIIPVISYIGPMFADIITGNIIVEHSFGIPGVGESYISFISQRDYPVVMGMTIFFTFIIVVAIFISDVLCAIINPNVDFN